LLHITKAKYFIWTRDMLFAQKLRAFFCASGKFCLLASSKENLFPPTLKFLLPTPQTHMYVQFHYWSKKKKKNPWFAYLCVHGT